MVKRIFALSLGIILVLSLFGCGAKEPAVDYNTIYTAGTKDAEQTEGNIVIDYYKVPMLNEGEPKFDEFAIHEIDGALYLNVYNGKPAGKEVLSHSAYIATPDMVNEVMSVVAKYDMGSWNDKNGKGTADSLIEVRYLDENGVSVKVSTDNMPKNGTAAFYEIYSFLTSHMLEGNKIK